MSETQTETPAAVPVRQRASTEFNYAAETATVTASDGSPVFTVSLEGIDDPMIRRLALRGLTYLAGSCAKLDTLVESLKAGTYGDGRAPASKPKAAPGPWRDAVAYAIVESAKKAGRPVTLEAAKDRVATFDTAQVRNMKTDPLVVKHYNKITMKPDAESAPSLLDLAGV